MFTSMTKIIFLTLFISFFNIRLVHAQREHVSDEKIRFALIDANYTNSSDGSIIPNITTGFRPFDYTWSGPDGFVSKDSVLHNLNAGHYKIHIEDALCGKFNDTMSIATIHNTAIEPSIKLIDVGPNPFGNSLRLTIKSEWDQEVEITIYSSFGFAYFHQRMQLEKGQNKITLDVATLPLGSFVLNVITKDNINATKTLIKS